VIKLQVKLEEPLVLGDLQLSIHKLTIVLCDQQPSVHKPVSTRVSLAIYGNLKYFKMSNIAKKLVCHVLSKLYEIFNYFWTTYLIFEG